MTASTHVILTHRVELEAEDATVARHAQDAWIERWSRGLEATIGAALDAAEDRHGALVLDRLDVDLGPLSPSEFDDLSRRLMQAIPRAIADAVARAPRERSTGPTLDTDARPPPMTDATEHAARAALHIAERGYRPWWAPDMADAALADAFVRWCADDTPAARATRSALRTDRAARDRLATCFGEATVAALDSSPPARPTAAPPAPRSGLEAPGTASLGTANGIPADDSRLPGMPPDGTPRSGIPSPAASPNDIFPDGTPPPGDDPARRSARAPERPRTPARVAHAVGQTDPGVAHTLARDADRVPDSQIHARDVVDEATGQRDSGPMAGDHNPPLGVGVAPPALGDVASIAPADNSSHPIEASDGMLTESSERSFGPASSVDFAPQADRPSPSAAPTTSAPAGTPPTVSLNARQMADPATHPPGRAGSTTRAAAPADASAPAPPVDAAGGAMAEPVSAVGRPTPPPASRVHPETGATAPRPEFHRPIRTGERIPARHAGLVLAWPFLPRTFRALGWWDGAWQGDGQTHAIHWLHRLASVDPTRARLEPLDAPTGTLIMPRLLCGLPFDAPIARRWALSDAAHDAADTLLQSMVTHWTALGGTSPDGLRQAFICRDGLLTHLGPDWHLRVDRQAHDVLLERLPWGFGTIRLRWTPYTLGVEW